ncbi:hypothetical protein LTS18_011682 [Coniosporium uncinatum]|uniref:Uncharacterized protein n=1 Tax=Coniosporium uncinatum TaxID=93489 RepID=A0ACC3CYJ8_9PEZI|nr:hypothetical protein LTS18_011682 [Coniosporium uncinatum]
MKVARVAEASIGDRSKYAYWNGTQWVAKPPAAANQVSNIFDYNVGGYGPGTGDIFWSAYFGTWLAVFFDGLSPNGTFRLMYSTNGKITGPWSTYQNLYVTRGCSGCGVSYNYASHAYPGVDRTGKTLLLGWTFNGAYTQFTTVTFQ